MSRGVVTLREDDDLAHVAQHLERYRYRYLPVVDEARHVVGLVTQHALFRSSVGEDPEAPSPRVRDVMAPPPPLTRPSTCLSEATRALVTHGGGALPVVDADDKLVGILTEHDLLRFMADELEELEAGRISSVDPVADLR